MCLCVRAHRAGLGARGSGAVPGQGHDDVALLTRPVHYHLVVGVIQVGLRETQDTLPEVTCTRRSRADNEGEPHGSP